MNGRRGQTRVSAAGWLVLLGAIAAAACGGDGAASSNAAATRRDSAGVAIVENASPADSAGWTWWRVEGPALDIGAVEAEGPTALFQVSDALRLADGGIAVANGGSSEIRFFDATGAPVRSVGRKGGGPGEFQRLGLLLPGAADSLLVVDNGARRVSVLAPDGTFAHDFELRAGGNALTLIGRQSDGLLVGQGSTVFARPDQLKTGMMRPPVMVQRFTAEAEPADTIGTFPGREGYIRIGEGSIEILRLPFGRSTSLGVCGNETFVATEDAPEIRSYGPGGLARIVRTGAPPRELTESIVTDIIETRVARAPDEQQAALRARLQEVPRPATLPAYGTVTADRDCRLWVADFEYGESPSVDWTVYAPDGTGLARIRLPREFDIMDAGSDWVLGRWRDELEVEHVRLYTVLHP